MRPPLSYVPALFPLAGLIAGILFGAELTAVGAAAVAAAGIALLSATRRRGEWWLPVGLTLLIAGAGAADMLWQRPADATALPPDREWWQGEVLAVADSDRGRQLTVRLDSIAGGHRLVALVHTKHGSVESAAPGHVVRFRCLLKAPVGDTGPVSGDYAAMLARRGIAVTGFAAEIAIVGHRQSWRSLAWRCRCAAEAPLRRSSISDPAYSFLVAVLVGDDDWLLQSTRDTFSAAGLAHMLALSGLHVGIIAGLLGLLLLPLGLAWDWRWRCATVILVLWAYALLTGMSASVTRAVLMASLVGGGIILQRPYVAMNGLLVAALIILAANPGQLFMPGFQMSFLAVASILLLMPALAHWINRLPRPLRWLATAAALSLAAMAGTAMVALYYFNIFPVYFLLANLPVALLLPVLMVGGLLLMAVEAVGWDPAWLCAAIDWTYAVMHRWAEAVVEMPSATLRNVAISATTLVPYYATLLLAAAALWRRSAGWGVALSAALLATAVTARLTEPREQLPQWFIPRDAHFTTVLYRPAGDGPATMISTAPPQAREALRHDYEWRYRRWLAAAGTDTLTVAPGPVAALADASRLVVVNSDTLLRNPPPGALDADYLLLCRGCRSSWRNVAKTLRPRTLLLSADIPKRRHLAVRDSILAILPDSTALISLRDSTFTAP